MPTDKDLAMPVPGPGSTPSGQAASRLVGSAGTIPIAEAEELHALRLEKLEALMSDISEDHWCAGWISGNEIALFRMAFLDAPLRYGMGEVSQSSINEVRRLAEATGCWFQSPSEPGDWELKVVPLAEFASAIEARRAETAETGSVHESAAPKGDAQDPSRARSAIAGEG